MYTLYDTYSKTIINSSLEVRNPFLRLTWTNTINYYIDIFEQDMYLPIVDLMFKRTIKSSSWSHVLLDGKVDIHVR